MDISIKTCKCHRMLRELINKVVVGRFGKDFMADEELAECDSKCNMYSIPELKYL